MYKHNISIHTIYIYIYSKSANTYYVYIYIIYHVYILLYIFTYMHICTYIYIILYMCTYLHMYIYIYTYTWYILTYLVFVLLKSWLWLNTPILLEEEWHISICIHKLYIEIQVYNHHMFWCCIKHGSINSKWKRWNWSKSTTYYIDHSAPNGEVPNGECFLLCTWWVPSGKLSHSYGKSPF